MQVIDKVIQGAPGWRLWGIVSAVIYRRGTSGISFMWVLLQFLHRYNEFSPQWTPNSLPATARVGGSSHLLNDIYETLNTRCRFVLQATAGVRAHRVNPRGCPSQPGVLPTTLLQGDVPRCSSGFMRCGQWQVGFLKPLKSISPIDFCFGTEILLRIISQSFSTVRCSEEGKHYESERINSMKRPFSNCFRTSNTNGADNSPPSRMDPKRPRSKPEPFPSLRGGRESPRRVPEVSPGLLSPRPLGRAGCCAGGPHEVAALSTEQAAVPAPAATCREGGELRTGEKKTTCEEKTSPARYPRIARYLIHCQKKAFGVCSWKKKRRTTSGGTAWRFAGAICYFPMIKGHLLQAPERTD